MTEHRTRSAFASLLSLSLFFTAWPAWAQFSRVAAPTGAAGIRVAPVAAPSSTLAAPALSGPSASLVSPSVQVSLALPNPVPPRSAAPAQAAAAASIAVPAEAPAAAAAQALAAAASPVRAAERALSRGSAASEALVAAKASASLGALSVGAQSLGRASVGARPALLESLFTGARARGADNAVQAAPGSDSADRSTLEPAARSAPQAALEPAAPQAPQPFFSPAVTGYLLSFFAGELWVEATAFAIPLLTKALSDGFMSMGIVAAASAAALGVGNLVGGLAVDRFGVRSVYVGMMAARTAAAGALGVMFISGSMGLPALAGLFALEYFFIGVSRVAESALPGALFGGELNKLNRFGSWQMRVLSSIGILGPVAVTGLIAGLGFGPALLAFAAVLALGTVLAFLAVRVPEQKSDFDITLLGRAAKALRENPILQRAAWGAGFPLALVFFLYLVVGYAVGLYVGGTPAAATTVMAWLVGLYSAGGFTGSVLSSYWTNRATERLNALGAVPPTQLTAAARRLFFLSTRHWLYGSAAALLGTWALVAAFPGLGLIPALAAMFALGLSATGAMVQSETLVRDEAPEAIRGTVLGLVRSLTMFAIAAAFLPLAAAFQYFSQTSQAGLVPTWPALAAVAAAASAGAYLVMRLAGRLSLPPPAPGVIAPDALPKAGEVVPGLTTLAVAAKSRPREELNAQIRLIGIASGFGRWMDVLDAYLAMTGENILLKTDVNGNVIAFLMLDHDYTTDFGETVNLPGYTYIGYMASRKDVAVKGLGKELLFEAARRAAQVADALTLHVIADDLPGHPSALPFYEAMAKYIPIKSQVMDTAYVAGERWIRIEFDVRGLK
ncbi:MAG: hypothetical protein HYZ75_16135 [Elusimicrobia bacterium]|nr:hypothetical protein [Elusimicrobiota bacterium]